MITETHFRLPFWVSFGRTLCIKKDLLYIPAFQYLKVENFVESLQTMI
jgi:hypothetical protein